MADQTNTTALEEEQKIEGPVVVGSKNTVSFSDALRVHVYLQTVSANPSVTRGIPIQLDWKIADSLELSLKEEELNAIKNFEENLSPFDKKNVYPRPVIRLSANRRKQILEANSISKQMMTDFEKIVEETKQQRKETIQNMNSRKEKWAELLEEKRQDKQEKPKNCLFCASSGATAAVAPRDLSPAEQYLERMKLQGTDMTSHDFVSGTEFLHGKSACKNCSQRAMELDKACVQMFRCEGKCKAESKECPIHKFIEKRRLAGSEPEIKPQESATQLLGKDSVPQHEVPVP